MLAKVFPEFDLTFNFQHETFSEQMLVNTEGIVLHFIKYGESSVIAAIYTREFGRQSYLLNAARSKKSKNKASLLQPLFLVDIVAYQKQNRDIHRIKEIKSSQFYENIPFDVAKSSIAIFLSEVLYKILNEAESYPGMYEFIKNSILYFDLSEEGASNFHLYFLFRLTEYIGFLPHTQKEGFQSWFDMRKGKTVPFQPSHPMYLNKDVTEEIIRLGQLRIQDLATYKISRLMRDAVLSGLLDYYHLHFNDLGEIKSLKVLREVFS